VSRVKRRAWLAGLGALPMAAWPPARKFAWAAADDGPALNISPVLLTLGAVGDTEICTVNNFGGAAAGAQVRLKSWTQSGGQDVLSDTADVVASPPFMSIDPGQKQIVRVVNLSAAPGLAEQAFRFLLNEIPVPGTPPGKGISFMLEFSVPMFLPGAGSAPPMLQAAFVESGGRVVLRLVNQGDVHARLTNLSYRDPGGTKLLHEPGLAGYVLSHATRDLPTGLRAMPPPGGTLMAQTQLSAAALPINLVATL
jgi:fimbrial chaperone protein